MFHFLVALRIQTPPENLVEWMVSTSHPRIGFLGEISWIQNGHTLGPQKFLEKCRL